MLQRSSPCSQAAVAIAFLTFGAVIALGVPPSATTVVDLSAIDAGFLANQSVDGRITTAPVALVAKQKMSAYTGGDFEVRRVTGANAIGDLAYVVRGKEFSIRGRALVMDPSGQKLALVQKYLLSAHKEYIIYTYAPNTPPNTPRQKSTEADDDGVPVYRFADVYKAVFALTSEFYYTLYDGNDLQSSSLLLAKVQGSLSDMVQMQMVIKVPGDAHTEILGTVGKQTMFNLPRDSTWEIEIGKGMDELGMLCLTLAVDFISSEGSGGGCFDGASLVTLANGSAVPIETIRAGELVAGWPSAEAALERGPPRPMRVASVQHVHSGPPLVGAHLRLPGDRATTLKPFFTPNHAMLAADGVWRAVDAPSAQAEVDAYGASKGGHASFKQPQVGALAAGASLLRFVPAGANASGLVETATVETLVSGPASHVKRGRTDVFSLELEVPDGGYAAYVVNGILVMD